MDPIEQKILSLLSHDGRMSFTDLGKETGLSTSAAQQRVRKLEQRKIIRGYHVDIDPESVKRSTMAMIQLRPSSPKDDEIIPGILTDIPEIIACYSIAGDASYLAVARVESAAKLDSLLSHIRKSANCMTSTTMILDTIFSDRPIINPDRQ